MVDVFEYLKQTKNALVGNPSAKLELQRTQEPAGSLLASIVSYVNLNPLADVAIADSSYSEETTAQIRVEAANVIASLAHGPRDVLHGLLDANAPSAVLNALADLSDHSSHLLQVAIIRALRALYVAIADGTGPSLWGLGEECLEFTSEMRTALDFTFQSQALNVYLPLLASSSPFIRLYISQLLAFAVRVPNHRIAVTDWLPPGKRLRESKGKRGWEVSALVDVNSPGRSGGWVIRHLTMMLKSKDFKTQEASLYAIAALVKDNTNIALVLSKSPPENKAYHILSIAADLSRDRRSEVRLAACLCITNILRSVPTTIHRRLSCSILHVLSAIISNNHESAPNRTKACFILSSLVVDDNDRCVDAWKSGALIKLTDVMQVITPLTKPQEWEDGEAKDISRFREAALTAIGALCLLESDIRNEVAGVLGLLPLIAVCLDHPYAGVRYGACLCVRALARSIRVLRTNLLDSGVGMTMCTIVEKKDEDRRVTNIALAGLCNLLNDFSPLRKTLLERGMVTRISELSRSQEDALRVSALWAIKNLLNKATTEEKQIIMSQLGWEHLKSCLVDPKEAIQEQALNILTNIASAENHIDMVFEHLSGYELMQTLADALESPSEEVVSQAVYVLGNLANGRAPHRVYLVSNARILNSLRACLTHSRSEIRHATVSCVEELSRTHPYQLKEVKIDETLHQIIREALSTSNLSCDPPEGRRRVGGGIEVEAAQEIREAARSALRFIENMDDYSMA